jgi:hypothetical protein
MKIKYEIQFPTKPMLNHEIFLKKSIKKRDQKTKKIKSTWVNLSKL